MTQESRAPGQNGHLNHGVPVTVSSIPCHPTLAVQSTQGGPTPFWTQHFGRNIEKLTLPGKAVLQLRPMRVSCVIISCAVSCFQT